MKQVGVLGPVPRGRSIAGSLDDWIVGPLIVVSLYRWMVGFLDSWTRLDNKRQPTERSGSRALWPPNRWIVGLLDH